MIFQINEKSNTTMQSQIQQCKDFDTEITIECLQAIKQHALNYQESLYVMEIIDNALVNFLLIKQKV